MPELPQGMVAFLFTDIEGSTRLWHSHREAMERAYTRHDAILREAIAAQRGVVYKVIGDAFQVAFPTVPEAVAAALEAQRALVAEDWSVVGLPEPLRIRMALHVGDVDPGPDGDYRSPVLNRVGRLLGAGHGGQVLLSQAVFALAHDHMPEGAVLRDLGERRLKDLGHPEPVWQLQHSDLPGTFPPLRTLDARFHNLPAQLTRLIGREREVVAIRAVLEERDARLVTLTGPGGVGKTRLALQVAAELVDTFADGTFVVDLAPLSDAGFVPTEIAAALGVREEEGRPLTDALPVYLRERELLLLLDNCEHLVTLAPLVAALLATAPGLRVLATSRAPLRLRGEREVPVAPLLPDEAVQLFVARARDVRPGFAVDDENAGAVAAICRRLEGLPLALELAAARIRMLSPQALLKRLERRLGVLTGGARDTPARQRTLRATLAWSHDLLSPDEQALFRRLAIFSGGCTLEAAAAVTDPEDGLGDDVLDGLAALVEQSLLRQGEPDGGDAEPRFAMLETVREYATERLEESDEAGAVRRAHAEWYLALAESSSQSQETELTEWLARLEPEQANLRVALEGTLMRGEVETAGRLGAALRRFWQIRGHLSEGRRWLEQILVMGEAIPVSVRARVLHGGGVLAERQGDLGQATALFTEALALFRAQDDRPNVATSLLGLGIVANGRGDFAQAEALTTEALALFRAQDDRKNIARALDNLGVEANRRGDLERAAALHAEALALCRELGDQQGAAFTLINLGDIELARGDLVRAAALFEEVLALARVLGDQATISLALTNLGVVANRRGDLERAAALHAEALALSEELGDRWGMAISRHSLGETALAQRKLELALTRYTEALALWGELSDPWGTALGLEGVARVATEYRRLLERTARLFGAAAALREAIGAVPQPWEHAVLERTVTAAQEQLGEAAFKAAWDVGRMLPLDEAVAEARDLARALAGANETAPVAAEAFG